MLCRSKLIENELKFCVFDIKMSLCSNWHSESRLSVLAVGKALFCVIAGEEIKRFVSQYTRVMLN